MADDELASLLDQPPLASRLGEIVRQRVPDEVLKGRTQAAITALEKLAAQYPNDNRLAQAEIQFGFGLAHWYQLRPLVAATHFHSAAVYFRRVANALARREEEADADAARREQLRSVANEAVARRRAGQTSAKIQDSLPSQPSKLGKDPETLYLRGLLEYGKDNLAEAEAAWRAAIALPIEPTMIGIELFALFADVSPAPTTPADARVYAGLALVDLLLERDHTKEARETWDKHVAPVVGAIP